MNLGEVRGVTADTSTFIFNCLPAPIKYIIIFIYFIMK